VVGAFGVAALFGAVVGVLGGGVVASVFEEDAERERGGGVAAFVA
jgi:hypothetical protein